MEIIDGVLKEIKSDDIIDGTFIFPDGVTEIGENAFFQCKELKNITIPDSVTKIGEGAFYECSNLEKVILPKNLTIIDVDVFSYCDLLKDITIPDNVTEIRDFAFYFCPSLENIKLPNSVTKIGESAFSYCKSLESIKLPENLKIIEASVFQNCSSIKDITIPDGVTKIEWFAFAGCQYIENVRLPESVTKIGKEAFKNCKSLENIIIPEGIQEIADSTFENCVTLKNIILPDGVTRIGASAFKNCNSLENIVIPDGVTKIRESAFMGCESLESITLPANIDTIEKNFISISHLIKKLITPWGTQDIEFSRAKGIVTNYLYLYVNSILKEKYLSSNAFLYSNTDITELLKSDYINQDEGIQKFKNLFYKMRQTYDINNILFSRLSLNTTEHFDLNIWKRIYPIFFFDTHLTHNFDMIEAFSEMIEVFGLFENDSNKNKRIEEFINLLSKKSSKLTNEQCNHLLFYTDFEILDLYDQVNANYLVKKKNQEIPIEFSTYLKKELNEEMVSKVKKLSGTYGKQINDFIKENYELKVLQELKLKEEIDDENANLIIFNQDLIGHINYSSLHRMFDGCKKEYNEDFYNFFMENLVFILNDEKIQSNIKNIQSKFDKIKQHYLYTSGTDKVTLKQALDYLENETFDYNDGNYEFSQDVKKAGVSSQEAFDYYQKVFENNDIRKLKSLVRRSNVYEINGYTIKAELLRSDDSFGMLVGETNYTNCCQVFGGIGHNCMAHAVNSDDGGIFVTRLLKDGKWILLTQSWDWQNNNVYCHDNIEGTKYFKDSPVTLKEAVAKVLELDGKYIIEKSKDEVENYIKTRKNIIEKSLSENKDKELKELSDLEQREVVRVVTTGIGNDDLGIANYFSSSIKVNDKQIINGKEFTLLDFQPVDYDSTQPYFDKQKTAYSDADITQYIIAGSIEELCLGKLEPLVPIYRDDRRLVSESGEGVRNYTVKKIRDMEKQLYPDNMMTHQSATKQDFEDSNIYLGEDWYLIYEELDDNTIYISDLAKIKPTLEDEGGIQNQEIMNVIYDLVRKYDKVEADLKEDTSYLLFLINKKLGYFEQIGEDISYSFNDSLEKKNVSEEEQETILRNAKTIKQNKNPEQIMHKITFKKGKSLDKEDTLGKHY